MLVHASLADVVDEPLGLLARVRPVALELGLEALDAIVVNDDVEQVVVAEVVEHRLQGLPCLLDLLAGHRSRPVDHEDDRLGQRSGVGGLDLGAGQEQEVAVLAGLGR